MTSDQTAAPPPSAPQRPRTTPFTLQRAALLWLACTVVYALVALLARFYDRFPGDEAISDAFQRVDVPALGGYLTFVNTLGGTWVHPLLVVGVAVLLGLLRAGWEALLALYTLVPSLADNLIKEWVARPRPSEDLVEVAERLPDFSYPSGHVVNTGSIFLVLFFAVPVVASHRWQRLVLQTGCLLMFVSAGPARIYDGVHWTSDVIAGYALVALLVLPLLLMYLPRRTNSPRPADRSRLTW